MPDRIRIDAGVTRPAPILVHVNDVAVSCHPGETVATALLLSLPVFYAEAWLLICRMTRREQARRLTVPFSVVSTGATLFALWLTRTIEVSFFGELLPQTLQFLSQLLRVALWHGRRRWLRGHLAHR